MFYEERKITLKDGRSAILRGPKKGEGAELLAYLINCYSETEFLLNYPEEMTFTPEQEEVFINISNDADDSVMIVCLVDGKIAGNCMLTFNTRIKTRHRAEIAIAISKAYWGLGIGTALFESMIQVAEEKGLKQLELGVMASNTRAIHLYEKMGCRIAGTKPNTYILKDGTVQDEHFMVRPV